jgi:hypothetical protein
LFFRREELKLLAKQIGETKSLYLVDRVIEEQAPRVLRHWEREGSGGPAYPPSTLQSLIRITLLAEVPVSTKNFIIMYFLLDLVDLLDYDR